MLLSDTRETSTDKALLNKMTAKSPSGEMLAVKTETPAQALPGRWFLKDLQGKSDGPAMLAYVNLPSAHGAIIGAWNCRDATTSSRARDKICLRDVEDALELDQLDGEYALWAVGHSERSGRQVELVRPGGRVELSLELARSECEAVIIAKVWEVNKRRVAVVGMPDKFAALAGMSVDVKNGKFLPVFPPSSGLM